MLELRVIRRFELVFICILVMLHVAVNLYIDLMHYNSMLIIDKNAAFGAFTSYNQWLNMIFPAVARAILLLAAWYIFHYRVFPKIKAREFEEKTIRYTAVVLLLVAAGVFLYYYFKLYLHFHLNQNIITDIKVTSLYRKMTIFSDTIGILIVIGVYEQNAQQFYYIHQQLRSEKENMATFLSYFFVVCAAIFISILAILVPIPSPLWQKPIAHILLAGGMFVLIHLLYVFVLHFLLPIARWPLSDKFIRNLTIYMFISIAGVALLWGCYNQFQGFSNATIFVYLIVLLLSWGFAYAQNFSSREKVALQTQVSVSSAELASLRSQINPHFLFNALNSLYATALKENSEKTADGIQKLGDMMHFMLQENNMDRILLSKEIEYLHNYIVIQRMRIDQSQRVEIRVNIQEPDKEIYISPMMLNPFVENAFKHGVSLQNPSWIYITLTLDATKLYFKVHNSLHSKSENDPEHDNSGVGLANVKKRLELIYPNRHTLNIQQSDKDYFVSLTMGY